MPTMQIIDMGVMRSVIMILNSGQCGENGEKRRQVSTRELRKWLKGRQIQTDDDNKLKKLIDESKT